MHPTASHWNTTATPACHKRSQRAQHSLIQSASAQTVWTQIESPLGTILLTAQDHALTGLWFSEDSAALERSGARAVPAHQVPVLAQTRAQLRDYFAGALKSFDLPMALKGTDFQREVWRALMQVPYGGTATYGVLAQRLNKPQAARAVGTAVGANPISIIIPCHRIVGSQGTLTGYAWGLERKAKLLALEGKQPLGSRLSGNDKPLR